MVSQCVNIALLKRTTWKALIFVFCNTMWVRPNPFEWHLCSLSIWKSKFIITLLVMTEHQHEEIIKLPFSYITHNFAVHIFWFKMWNTLYSRVILLVPYKLVSLCFIILWLWILRKSKIAFGVVLLLAIIKHVHLAFWTFIVLFINQIIFVGEKGLFWGFSLVKVDLLHCTFQVVVKS